MKSVKLNAILNTLKTICSIIFPLITIPYASRVLHASNYGIVSWCNSIIQYFALFATLGVVTYAQREGPQFRDQKQKFQNFASEVFTINVAATIVSYLALFACFFIFAKMRNYKVVILVQSLMIILTTLGVDWINAVYEDYFYITLRYIIIQLVCLAGLFLFVRNSQDYLAYALIMVIANAGGNLLNIFYVRRYTTVHLVPLSQCKKHMGPTIKLFAVSLASVIYVSSDITILGIFRGNKDVGIYTIASRVDSTIKTVLNAVMTVAMPRLAFYLGHQDEKQFNALIHNIFDYLITFVLPVICGLFMLAGPIMYLLGGSEYVQGYLSLQILSVSLFFAVLACFFATGIILLYKMDNVYLMATIVSSMMNIILNFVLIPYMGYNGAAFTTLLAEMIMMGITAYYSLQIPNIKKHKREIFGNTRVVFSSVLGTLGIVISCLSVKMFIFSQILIIIASVIVSVVVYACILKIFHNPIYDYVISALKSKLLK